MVGCSLRYEGRRQRRAASRATAAVLGGLIFVLVLGACGGDDDVAPTLSPAPDAPTPTLVAATFTPEPTSTAIATATVTAVPTATRVPVLPSPTPATLPSAGGELTIFGREVSQIVAGSADGTILYAVSSTRLARSPDGGVTWFAQGRTPPGRIVPALNDPDRIYAGDLGSCAMSVITMPLSYTADAGRVWEQVPGVEGIKPLLVDAGTPNLLIGSSCTLEISVDGGVSWQFVPETVNYDVRTAASSERGLTDKIAVVGTSEGGSGILWGYDVSTPGVLRQLGELATFWGTAGVAWQDGRLVLATTTGVGISDDDGATWTWSRAGLEAVTYSVDPLTEAIPADEAEKVVGFGLAAIDPENADRIWVAGVAGIFRSDDGGATWTRLGTVANVDSLAVSLPANRVYATADGRTYAWELTER